MARIAVIGAGIVGLACAFHLRADGHEIVVIDSAPEGDKCSWGNAGGIGVTEVVPAAVPGLFWRVPGWLLDPLGPLALRPAHAPRQRQREVAETAEQVEHGILGARLEQGKTLAHQSCVDVAVDLDEIDRAELDRHASLIHRVLERRVAVMQRPQRVER